MFGERSDHFVTQRITSTFISGRDLEVPSSGSSLQFLRCQPLKTRILCKSDMKKIINPGKLECNLQLMQEQTTLVHLTLILFRLMGFPLKRRSFRYLCYLIIAHQVQRRVHLLSPQTHRLKLPIRFAGILLARRQQLRQQLRLQPEPS